MRLYVSDIAEEGISVSFCGRDGSWEGLKSLAVESLPEGSLFVEKKRETIRVQGQFRATVKLECSRCLKMYAFAVDIPFTHYLRPGEEQRCNGKERELFAEDLEYGYYEGDVIELEGIVEEVLLLAIPMKPLCAEECKGLCPWCGADKNEGGCQCPERFGGSPFDILKKIVT